MDEKEVIGLAESEPKKKSVYIVLRNRILSGFFLALPLVLTFVILNWVYKKIVVWILGPIYFFVLDSIEKREARNGQPDSGELPLTDVELPFWVNYIVAPIITVTIFLLILFLLGLFFKSRFHRWLDWLLLQVPVVSWVYSVALKVVDTVQTTDGKTPKFKRVVLVEFPHPGMKAPAFVTNTCIDNTTGEKILCVYVPTTPVPTSGYMLLVPEKSVTELSWHLQETLEAIISGGVTAPGTVDYFMSSQVTSALDPSNETDTEPK